jgi:HEAT repeat protein
MPVLIAILTTGRPGDSQPPSIAMKCLAQIGPAAKAAAPSLLKVLKEPDVAPGSPAPDALDEPARKAGQVEAADALLHIGEEPARPIAILRRMLADTRSTPSWAHLHAAEILLERKIDTGYAMELLGDWVKHGGPDRAPAALDVLARLSPDPSAAVARIKPALHNGSALVRQAAVESLGKLGPAASSSIPDLRIAQIDANQFVRWQATWALSRIGGGDAK